MKNTNDWNVFKALFAKFQINTKADGMVMHRGVLVLLNDATGKEAIKCLDSQMAEILENLVAFRLNEDDAECWWSRKNVPRSFNKYVEWESETDEEEDYLAQIPTRHHFLKDPYADMRG